MREKAGTADKGINPEATVFSTLSQSVLVKRYSVMITTCVYGMSLHGHISHNCLRHAIHCYD